MAGSRLPRSGRARPVADAPVEALLARAEAIAKDWVLELLAQAPLEALAAFPASDLARDAPRLCGAIARALASDAALAELGPDGSQAALCARVGHLAGAHDAIATVAAVEALRAVLWSAMLAELERPDARQVAELAERLAAVAVLIGRTALGALFEPAAGEPSGPTGPHQARHVPTGEEHAWPLWMGAVERQIAASGPLQRRFALLLVEIDEADRLLASEGEERAALAFTRVAQALRGQIRRPDVLAREEDGRAWVLAADTGRAGAGALAARMARVVGATEAFRGAPLTASVGVAVFPEDGRDAETLADCAEEAVFASRSDGLMADDRTRVEPADGRLTSGRRPLE